MDRVKRRHFLQLASSTLAAIGCSQKNFLRVGNNAGKVLATETSRKLALLVGINKYDGMHLNGCITDVEMQKELLVSCFGFLPEDIKILTDNEATRESILSAFEEHLIKQAKPEDVVVFHYSGHGSRFIDLDSSDGFDGTLVPIDSISSKAEKGTAKDISGSTLFLLTSALQTDKTTMILDCCYSGGTTRGNSRGNSRGNFKFRSSFGGKSLEITEIEKEYQRKWLAQLNLSSEEFQQRRQKGIAKGAAITSSQKNQLAADIFLDDFAVGAFTYALTQYLWQTESGKIWFTPSVEHTKYAVSKISSSPYKQEPMLEIAPQLPTSEYPVYFLEKKSSQAEAVITKIVGNSVDLWLGGINAQNISSFNRGATFSAIDLQQNKIATVELNSRNGLVGIGRLISSDENRFQDKSLKKGSLLRDEIHSIPTNFALKIGVDDRDFTVYQEIQSAFASWKNLKIVSLQQEEVDYIFARNTPEIMRSRQSRGAERSQNPPLAVDSFGLFYPDMTPIPNSFGTEKESITSAIKRLMARIKSLIAIKLIRLTFNPNASRLKISASLYDSNNSRLPLVEAVSNKEIFFQSIKQIPLNLPLQLTISNQENRLLYFSVLAIDAEGQIVVIFPNQWINTEEQIAIAPQEIISIPESPNSEFNLQSAEPLGITEILVVASTTYFENLGSMLEQIARRNNVRSGAIPLTNPWEAVSSLVSDIDISNTRNSSQQDKTQQDAHFLIDTAQLGVLSLSFEVTAES